jgi:carbon monoxide dehydrogenase subunit G
VQPILIENVFSVAATPEAILAHLAEPASNIGLSPLIVSVDDVRTVEDIVHYVAVERFRFGPIRHDNRIAVTLRTGTDRVWGEVVSPGRVRMDYAFTLVADGDRTTVTDTLRLRAPFGLRRFAAGQARAVQLNRARVLAERLG